ncbi:MAG: hypothetical protein ACXWQ5_21090 [Ktedonobacterales bacterium]
MSSMTRLVSDQSNLFTRGLAVAWVVAVALPLFASVQAEHPWRGVPLLGVVLWFGLLRAARGLSPAARTDGLMARGKYDQALALCDQALAVSGEHAWVGTRRLVWLNRRTNAFLGLGRASDALVSALEAMAFSADPETVGNCAMALLRLNRYEEATGAARLALSLTRERSVISHAVLAQVMLARGMRAEAEALARAGAEDASALIPLVRTEYYAMCLAVASRSIRLLGRKDQAKRYLGELRKVTRTSPFTRCLALIEEADGMAARGDAAELAPRIFELLASAQELAPSYVSWYLTQPGTFVHLADNERIIKERNAASAYFQEMTPAAPGIEDVAMALAVAQRNAHPRPAPQASREALLVQVITLSGTFALLLLWTWHFYLSGA